MNTPIRFLDLNEATSRLHICKRTYYRLVQAKELPPPVKIGGKSLVPETDLERFISRLLQERAASAAPAVAGN